ncbi:MAG TPA: SoxR reducing system RseC family protein [Clostridia bacterium]|nr:SoxR reducing system RseC family protein [Clostridia bacterium]
MIEIGEVKKITKSGWCTVRFPRKTACENCHMCLKPKDEMFVELKLRNTLAAKEGDTVSVEIGDRAPLIASLITYIIPLILVGIALGATAWLDSPAASLGAAGGALLLSFVITMIIDRKLKGKKNFTPRMFAIIKAEQIDTEIEN